MATIALAPASIASLIAASKPAARTTIATSSGGWGTSASER